MSRHLALLGKPRLAVKVLVYAERRHRKVGVGMVEAGGSGSCRSSGWPA